jgi:hypothetical protein
MAVRTAAASLTSKSEPLCLECERPGTTVSAIARTYRLATSVLFRWRAELGYGRNENVRLAPVKLADGRSEGGQSSASAEIVLQGLLPTPDGMAAVDLSDGRRVFAPVGSDPESVRRHIAGKQTAS